jgi:hypothetical protein
MAKRRNPYWSLPSIASAAGSTAITAVSSAVPIETAIGGIPVEYVEGGAVGLEMIPCMAAVAAVKRYETARGSGNISVHWEISAVVLAGGVPSVSEIAFKGGGALPKPFP